MHQQQQPQHTQGAQFGQGQQSFGQGGGQSSQQGIGQMGGGQQGGQFSQVVGQSFSQVAPPTLVQTVVDLDRLETVAAYAHNTAMQQGNHQVALIADAIEEIARLQKELVVMANPLANELSRCSQQVIQTGISQLQPYTQTPEVQELVYEAQQTTQRVPQVIQQTLGGSQGSSQGSQGTW